MYSHESTCTICGNNFIVEVVPGQPMQQRGVCDRCIAIERQKAEAARNRQLIKWGVFIGGPILLIFLIAYACST